MSHHKSSHWGHFLAIAAVMVAIAALLFVRFYSHQRTVSSIYTAYLDSHWAQAAGEGDATTDTTAGLFATDAQRVALAAAADEGMCWAGRHYTAVNVWLVILVIVLILLMFYHLGSHKYTVMHHH